MILTLVKFRMNLIERVILTIIPTNLNTVYSIIYTVYSFILSFFLFLQLPSDPVRKPMFPLIRLKVDLVARVTLVILPPQMQIVCRVPIMTTICILKLLPKRHQIMK